MERIRQVISSKGLEIPLPIMERYGLQPGQGVVLELDGEEIRIRPVVPGREDIENQALRYTLAHLGDAASVSVAKTNGHWQVSVYGTNMTEPLGHLVFSEAGELVPERSTPVETMRQRAIATT